MLVRGLLFGTASDAVQMTTSGMTPIRSSGVTLLRAVVSIKSGGSLDVDQFDDAMMCICSGEESAETTKKLC
jgi:hypothetical protein